MAQIPMQKAVFASTFEKITTGITLNKTGTAVQYTIPEDGFYGAVATNEGTEGTVAAQLYWGHDNIDNLISAGTTYSSGTYRKSVASPVGLAAGSKIQVRTWAPSTGGNVYLFKMK